MKNTLILFIIFLITACSSKKNLTSEVRNSLNTAVEQYLQMDKTLPDSLFPRTTGKNGELITNKSWWWTSGFYPGSLWYLYEFSNNEDMKQAAKNKLTAVEPEKNNYHDHDIGFKILCSFGNAYRITGDTSYIAPILIAARTSITRFDSVVGCIRSWDAINDTTRYRVIVDNMMNLELLFWATQKTGDSLFYNIAVSHANKTMENHYRPDGSSYHLVNYDQGTGQPVKKQTVQGYADESSWARGQAWGLYGFVMCYRETGYEKYLEHAKKIAYFLLNHPNLPEDKIPYWDFNDPEIPEALRDASAGAIIASALVELSSFCSGDDKDTFLNAAKEMVHSLNNEPYRAKPGENNNFLLKHSVGNIPENSEVDVPLSYADYYYIEAMMRLLALE